MRTGDASDGLGYVPAAVWSATPLDANETPFLGMPLSFSLLQPPTVVGDTILIGWAGKDRGHTVEPPENVIAVKAPAGKLQWDTGLIPPDFTQVTGTANIWSSMSADPDIGLVCVPVSSPSPCYLGGNQTADILVAVSFPEIEIDMVRDMGRVACSFQHVHHDVWNYNMPLAETLVNLTCGAAVPALVQTTKRGFIFVQDSRTNAPLFPIKERAVRESDADVEQLSATQPFADVPVPTIKHPPLTEVCRLADALSSAVGGNSILKPAVANQVVAYRLCAGN